MPAWSRICSPASTASPPIQLASTGLPAILAYCRSCLRRSPVGSVMAWGVRIDEQAVDVGVLWPRPPASWRSARASASPRMSIGLPWLQAAGRNASSALDRRGRELRRARRRFSIRASVASTPGPPALVTIASRGPSRPGLLGEHLGHVEDLRDRVDPQHADAAEGGVEHLVAAGERAGVRRRRLGRRLGPARLDHDDRLGQRHLARRRQERPRIADRFHVDHDALGVRVVAEVVDQVAPADVEHRADRDERAEADVHLQAPVEDGRAEGAALADEADGARPGDLGGEGGVEAAARDSSRPGSWAR